MLICQLKVYKKYYIITSLHGVKGMIGSSVSKLLMSSPLRDIMSTAVTCKHLSSENIYRINT
jgi:hypothetical protein